MSKKISITEQIEELQEENARLKEYEKLFEKALKNEFGFGRKAIKKMLAGDEEKTSEFERKLCTFFGLETAEDKAAFLAVMCSESSLRFFNGKRENVTIVE